MTSEIIPVIKTLEQSKYIEREGFTAQVFVSKEDGLGYSALLVNVFEGSPPKKMVGATRSYFVVEGDGLFTLNGVEQSVKKGDLVVIPDQGEYSYKSKTMVMFEFNVPATDAGNSILLGE